jgi:hypothetical protein
LDALMPTRLIDWFARTVMLVLAGLVTLSILGAIAAIPNDPGGGGFLFEQERDSPASEQRVPEPAPAPRPEPTPEPDDGAAHVTGPAADSMTSGMSAVPPVENRDRWLETIAYALLALAGLVAFGLVLLALAVRQLRRISEALISSRE